MAAAAAAVSVMVVALSCDRLARVCDVHDTLGFELEESVPHRGHVGRVVRESAVGLGDNQGLLVLRVGREDHLVGTTTRRSAHSEGKQRRQRQRHDDNSGFGAFAPSESLASPISSRCATTGGMYSL